MNNTCPLPLCGRKTEGKAVRGVNFCKDHHAIAVFVRDDKAIKKEEEKRGQVFYGRPFIQIVIDITEEASRRDIPIVGI